MKHVLICAATAVLISLFVAPASFAQLRNLQEGEKAPDFTLNALDGSSVTLSSYAGKDIVVVTIVRPGQPNSGKAMADLQDLSAKYAGKDVVFLAMTPDTDNKAAAKEEADKAKVTYPFLLDEGRHVYGAWGAFLFPTTCIIAKDGTLAKEIPSYNRKYKDSVDAYLQLTLGEIDESAVDDIINPKDTVVFTPEQKKAERHLMLAQRMIDRSLLDKAEDDLKQAVELDPANAKARVTYGFVLLKLDRPEEAKAQFSAALEADARAEDAKAGLGAAEVALGDLDNGIATLEDSLKLNPKPARSHFELGKAYQKKGDNEKAAEHFRKAAEELAGALW